MKIRRIFGMLGIAAVLASCSQNEELLPDAADSGTTRVSINLTTTDVVTRAAATGVTNYVCEVYEGADASGARVGEQHTSADGKFALTLKKNTVYSFLFWADRGGEVYITTDLKEVRVNYPQDPQTEAWCGRVLNKTITAGDNEGFDVTLRHAVAKVVFHNTSPLTTEKNALRIGYPTCIHVKLNVATGGTKPAVNQTATVHRNYFNLPAAAGVILEDYVLAPETENALGDMTIQLNRNTPNEEPEKTLSNVPLRMNYVTRISGAYSNLYNTAFNVSNTVEDFNDTDHDF